MQLLLHRDRERAVHTYAARCCAALAKTRAFLPAQRSLCERPLTTVTDRIARVDVDFAG